MKQDILIYSSHEEHIGRAYAALAKHGISVMVVSDKPGVFSVLRSHIPSFLWIDHDTETAKRFLKEIMGTFLHPPPYIILTSSFVDSADRADMLDHGADACVEIPVDLKEILAILNAVLRREERLQYVSTTVETSHIQYKQLLIDPLHHKVVMKGREIDLTPKEYDILYLLTTNPGKVFTKEQIYTRIWKEPVPLGIDVVFNHIYSLRKKLGLGARDKEYIQTVNKVGYRFPGPA